jgi:hypothetical protein
MHGTFLRNGLHAGRPGKSSNSSTSKLHWRNSVTTERSCDGFREGVRKLVLAKRL